jgi:pyruvate dehydrogenase E1 component beta subunit/2-oxoisovalerate dehydrogenase E1 component
LDMVSTQAASRTRGSCSALADPNPVLIFEHVMLYNRSCAFPPDAGSVDVRSAAAR